MEVWGFRGPKKALRRECLATWQTQCVNRDYWLQGPPFWQCGFYTNRSELMKKERHDVVLKALTKIHFPGCLTQQCAGGWTMWFITGNTEACWISRTAVQPELPSFTHPLILSFSTISNLICFLSINMWEEHMSLDYEVVANIRFFLPGNVIRGSARWMT